MQKTISLFTAILTTGAFAVEMYTSEEIVSYSPAISTILHHEFTTEDSDSSAYFPYLPGYNAGPEESEPDEFLDEASSVDEMEPTEEAIAEAKLDSITIDMTQAAIPLESGRITSPFGFRRYRIHKGVDIGLHRGDPIRAAFPGRVARVRYERRGYGRYIVIEHENCGITRTVYAHLSKQLVKVGQTVEAGEVIGLGGNTGRSTGPHLHFEMRIGEIPLDPTEFFNFPNHTYTQDHIRLSTAVMEEKYAAVQKEASKHRYHRIRPGDTLGKIARMYHTSINRLLQLNGLKKNSVLRVGKIIRCS